MHESSEIHSADSAAIHHYNWKNELGFLPLQTVTFLPICEFCKNLNGLGCGKIDNLPRLTLNNFFGAFSESSGVPLAASSRTPDYKSPGPVDGDSTPLTMFSCCSFENITFIGVLHSQLASGIIAPLFAITGPKNFQVGLD
jgi:hypothetical protein